MRLILGTRWCWLALAIVTGCTSDPVPDTVQVRITASAELPLTADRIFYEPASNVRSVQLDLRGLLTIERRDRARPLTVHIREWCPIVIPAGAQRDPIAARPVIDLGGDRAPVGFDAPFTVKVVHGCPERGRGRIEWRQVEGEEVSELSIKQDGFELRARTPRFEALHPEPPRPGIVAFSPRTQGRVTFEAFWHGPERESVLRTITLRSTSRATGMSSVAVSQRIMLAGEDWRVQKAPQGGRAQVHPSGSLFSFSPDAPGRWTLEHDGGQALVLQALWHDKTPYDCGRSECHASLTALTRGSPMSYALQRYLEGPKPSTVGCMLECHVLGERGLHDGGFVDVANQLGFNWIDGTRWDELPQPLRRLGGVRCTACHGPGVLPEPEGRELILSSDVCATCHDAPPRYVHVEQWRASKMARSDVEPSTRTGVCASCHTTAGFLERVAGPRPKAHAVDEDSTPIGITCAACHAPHSAHRGARLVRTMPASTSDADAAPADPASALCLACHATTSEQALPSSPSGALWLGHVRVPARDGAGWELQRAAGAHGQAPGGCIGCHGASPDGRVEHSFRVTPESCAPCHATGRDPAPGQRELGERARALAQKLGAACAIEPAVQEHAHAAPAPAKCKTPQLTRALYQVGLVLEDRAAFVHNAALARLLLDDAERASQ